MDPYHIKEKKILFAVLNWGLGHATRSSVLIRELARNNKVILASDGMALVWLKSEFPEMRSVQFPELNMSYSKHFGATGGILRKLPHFLKSIKRDHSALIDLCKKEGFDLIISDNRYGVYSEKTPSILISHQLRLMNPFSNLIQLPLYNLIEKFDEVWVPDDVSRRISGLLSTPENGLKIPVNPIGPLSRFQPGETKIKKDIKFILIASGPMPHRVQLVDYFESNFSLLELECHIIAGDADRVNYKKGFLSYHANMASSEMEKLIQRAEYVICRSGYSSIMDLLSLKQKAILLPTPGQSEQRYLAEYHQENPLFNCVLDSKELPTIMKSLI